MRPPNSQGTSTSHRSSPKSMRNASIAPPTTSTPTSSPADASGAPAPAPGSGRNAEASYTAQRSSPRLRALARATGTVERTSPWKATQRRVHSPCSSARQDEDEITPAEPAVQPAKKRIRLTPRLGTERTGATSSRADAPASSRSPKRNTRRQLRNFPAKDIDAQEGEGEEGRDGHERDSETEESEGAASDGERSNEQEEDFMEDEDDSSDD